MTAFMDFMAWPWLPGVKGWLSFGQTNFCLSLGSLIHSSRGNCHSRDLHETWTRQLRHASHKAAVPIKHFIFWKVKHFHWFCLGQLTLMIFWCLLVHKKMINYVAVSQLSNLLTVMTSHQKYDWVGRVSSVVASWKPIAGSWVRFQPRSRQQRLCWTSISIIFHLIVILPS